VADYLYDIFVSYETDWLVSNWLKDHFLPFLQTWVRNTVPEICKRPARPIFFARSQVEIGFPQELKLRLAGIKPGVKWDEGLREGLRFSRCLIAIVNPPYFYSDPCKMEWESFQRRSDGTEKTAILPVLYYDGDSFPDIARYPQRIDLSNFALDGEALRNGKLYLEFQQMMRLVAQRAAETILNAPDFQEWQAEENPQPAAPPPHVGLPRYADAR